MKFILSAATGLVAAVLGLEALLRVLPVNSGISMEETTVATPYARYLPQQPYLYSYGWGMDNRQHGVTNRQGFSNSRDFSANANALVIGDSYIESFMLGYADTVQGRLDAAMGKVYAAAASGNGLADALQLSRHFLPSTQARHVVIFVEPGDLVAIEQRGLRGHNYFAFAGDSVSLAHAPYTESRFKRPIVMSALLRYMYYNLKFPDWLSMQFAPAAQGGDQAAAQARHRHQRELALNYLMGELKKLEAQYGTRFVFLVDGDRNAIYTPGKLPPNWPGDERETLIKHVRQNGFGLVDMQPVFAAHWQRYRERMDFLPMDGHWNKVAHGLAAVQILKITSSSSQAAAAAPQAP